MSSENQEIYVSNIESYDPVINKDLSDSENKQSPKIRKNEIKTKGKKDYKLIFKRILKFSIIFLLSFCLICFVVFIWDRWFRFDDAKDIQNTWKVNESMSTIVISDNCINLGKNAQLEYSIDANLKLIKYKIGNSEGFSRYRFSADRTQLAIFEQDNYNALFSLIDDIKWSLDSIAYQIKGLQLSPAYTIVTEDNNINNEFINDIDFSKTILLQKA